MYNICSEQSIERVMSECLENIEISLPLGRIKGVKRRGLYDDEYFSFERVPYGKPPLGELRFRAPQPVDSWSGVLDCTHYNEKPLQSSKPTGDIEGTEDCLYLNVYTKKLKSKKPLPVMVYIYGGAFRKGEATSRLFGPDYFMAKDVILVTFNYRLDCLGFLSLKDPSLMVPGNAGLKDQVLALKWVRQYISHFNGDNENITLFGSSAGGASTHYMMCTDQTRGLFHKAIVMSGTILNSWANIPAADKAYRLAKVHGYQGENIDRQVLEHLCGVPSLKLLDYNLLTDEDRCNDNYWTFGPTVEPYDSPECIVNGSQLDQLRNAWSNELPIMLGGASFEGLFLYPIIKANAKGMDTLSLDPMRVIPSEIRGINTEQKNLENSKRLIELHFGDATPSSKLLMNFLDLYSYKMYWHATYRTLLARLAYAGAPTYLYRFDYDSPEFSLKRIQFCGDDVKTGVPHAEELSYLFRNLRSWKLDKCSNEYRTIRRLTDIWTTFAASSDPNCMEISHLHWEPSSMDRPQRVLNISENVEIIDLPEYEKLLVWNTLYREQDLLRPNWEYL